MRLALVLAVALVATTPVVLAETPGHWLTLPWALPECHMVVAYVEAEPSAVREMLPTGFEPVTWGPLDQAKIIVEFAECGGLAYGNWEALVVPPKGLARDVGGHYVKFDTLVQDADTRAALVEWGLPVHDGEARVRQSLASNVVTAEMRMESVGWFFLNFTTTSAPPEPMHFPFLEFTSTASGGLATWDVELRDLALAQGVGVLKLPPESRLAKLAGSDLLPVEVWAGSWSSLQGSVATPAGMLPFVVGNAPPSVAVVAAVAAGGAAGVGVGWRVLRWLGAASAYSRFSGADAKDHPRRRAIIALVREQPGITPTELRRFTHYAPGVVSHHLRLLEQHGLVVRQREGLRTRVFDAAQGVVPVLSAARARVFEAITCEPGLRQRELADRLGISRWTVAHHARCLEQAGRVRVEAQGRERRYWPLPDRVAT